MAPPSVTGPPRHDARHWSLPAKHFPEIAHERFWLFVRRKVATRFVLRLGYDPRLGSQQASQLAHHQLQYVNMLEKKKTLVSGVGSEYVRFG